MAERDAIVASANALLEVERWPEFGTAGMQVVGAEQVTRLACGVSVTLELVEAAAARRAELLVVHHGLFWSNEPLVVERRMRGRLEALFRADMTLAAYHLPLDAHPELGNASRLAAAIGAVPEQPFAVVGLGCRLPAPTPIDELVTLVRNAVARDPLVFAEGPRSVERVAIVTGSGGYELIAAALEGYDALVTGEPEEPSLASARELGIHLVAAGHYATERLGVQALTERLAEEFGLPWEFIELEGPV